MSKLEYSDLIFRIGTKIGLNYLRRLVFMCREQISEDSKDKITNALELFEELEKQGNLGIDRLGTLKEILNQLKKRSMLKEVEEFEIKRKGAQLMLVILIYFEIQRRKFESQKCLFAQEVQFKAYSFFIDCKGHDFLLRGNMYSFDSIGFGYWFLILCSHVASIKNLSSSWL